MRLHNQAIQSFRVHGWLPVKRLFNDASVRLLSRWVEELEARPERAGDVYRYYENPLNIPGQRYLSRIENFCPIHESLDALAHGGRILGVVNQLFGASAVLFKDKVSFKRPGADGYRPHQDVQAGWDEYASLHITAMISLDACTPANGCLEIAKSAPARDGGLGYRHRHALMGQYRKPLEHGVADYMPVAMAPGDALFFDAYLPHRSRPNRTDSARRVLYLTYNRRDEGDHRSAYFAKEPPQYPPYCGRALSRPIRVRNRSATTNRPAANDRCVRVLTRTRDAHRSAGQVTESRCQ